MIVDEDKEKEKRKGFVVKKKIWSPDWRALYIIAYDTPLTNDLLQHTRRKAQFATSHTHPAQFSSLVCQFLTNEWDQRGNVTHSKIISWHSLLSFNTPAFKSNQIKCSYCSDWAAKIMREKKWPKKRLRLAFANQASYMLIPPSSDQLNGSLVHNEIKKYWQHWGEHQWLDNTWPNFIKHIHWRRR